MGPKEEVEHYEMDAEAWRDLEVPMEETELEEEAEMDGADHGHELEEEEVVEEEVAADGIVEVNDAGVDDAGVDKREDEKEKYEEKKVEEEAKKESKPPPWRDKGGGNRERGRGRGGGGKGYKGQNQRGKGRGWRANNKTFKGGKGGRNRTMVQKKDKGYGSHSHDQSKEADDEWWKKDDVAWPADDGWASIWFASSALRV